jgi:hypothetical protein
MENFIMQGNFGPFKVHGSNMMKKDQNEANATVRKVRHAVK